MTKGFAKRQFIIGMLVCVMGAICFSTKAIFVKLAYRDTQVEAVTLLALRMIFSLPFFVISAIVSSSRSGNVRFTTREWIYVGIIGCLGYYLSSLLDFIGLQYVSAGIERLILFIYPTLVLLISAVAFGQKIKRLQWIAVAITYAGLLLAFIGESSLHHTYDGNFVFGALMIFACAITFASYIVGSGRLIPKVGAAKFNSYAMSFASVAVVIHFLFTTNASLADLEGQVYIYALFMAFFSTVIPSYLFAEGIKRIGSDNAAIAASVGPVSTIIQAAIFLGEPVFALQIVGTLFVLGGVLLIGKKNT
ncbi:MAG TPA: DMT family transporter [Chryseosolibacter sp.]|nr:DMT family transporter [Chryseosolibacter sp.]